MGNILYILLVQSVGCCHGTDVCIIGGYNREERWRERERDRNTTKIPVGRTGFVREAELVTSQREGEIMNVLPPSLPPSSVSD